MARFHEIEASLWEELIGYDPNQKLLYIYLFSNPLCRPSGIYTINPITIKTYSGQSEEVLKSICGKLVEYDFKTFEVFVRGKFKRLIGGFKDNANMRKAVLFDFEHTQSNFIRRCFSLKYKEALKGLKSPPLQEHLPVQEHKEGVKGGEKKPRAWSKPPKQFKDLIRKLSMEKSVIKKEPK